MTVPRIILCSNVAKYQIVSVRLSLRLFVLPCDHTRTKKKKFKKHFSLLKTEEQAFIGIVITSRILHVNPLQIWSKEYSI